MGRLIIGKILTTGICGDLDSEFYSSLLGV